MVVFRNPVKRQLLRQVRVRQLQRG